MVRRWLVFFKVFPGVSKLIEIQLFFRMLITIQFIQKISSKRFMSVVHKKSINPLSANFTKWSNTLKQLVSNLPTNCLSVFDQFVGLALKGLR